MVSVFEVYWVLSTVTVALPISKVPGFVACSRYVKVLVIDMVVLPLIERMVEEVDEFGPEMTSKSAILGPRKPVPCPFTVNDRAKVSPTPTTVFADAVNSIS